MYIRNYIFLAGRKVEQQNGDLFLLIPRKRAQSKHKALRKQRPAAAWFPPPRLSRAPSASTPAVRPTEGVSQECASGIQGNGKQGAMSTSKDVMNGMYSLIANPSAPIDAVIAINPLYHLL